MKQHGTLTTISKEVYGNRRNQKRIPISRNSEERRKYCAENPSYQAACKWPVLMPPKPWRRIRVSEPYVGSNTASTLLILILAVPPLPHL